VEVMLNDYYSTQQQIFSNKMKSKEFHLKHNILMNSMWFKRVED